MKRSTYSLILMDDVVAATDSGGARTMHYAGTENAAVVFLFIPADECFSPCAGARL